MMNEFILLQPEEYKEYNITNPSNFVGEATWYIHTTSYNPYGPWLILSFLQPKATQDILTFRICRFDEDYFDHIDESTPFDIFCHSVPGSLFKHQTLIEMIKLLKIHAEKLVAIPKSKPNMFKVIPEADWPKWHLRPVTSKHKVVVYQQLYEPVLVINENTDFATIIKMSVAEQTMFPKKPVSLFLSVMRFLKNELNDPDYDPTNSWSGHINLDRQGIYEFVDLLEKSWLALNSITK